MTIRKTFHKFTDEEINVHIQLALQRTNEVLQMEDELKSLAELLESRKNNLVDILGKIKAEGAWI